jgi:hypothetical protein
MSDRTQIKLRIDITYDDVLRMFNEVEQKIRNEVVKFLPYPDVKLILTSFCLHRTVDDMYVVILKYKADVRYYDLRDIKNIDVVIRSDGVYAVL